MRSRASNLAPKWCKLNLRLKSEVVVGKKNMLGKRRDDVLDLRFNRTRVTGKKRGLHA
jgi:hypothetical protein